MPNLVVTIQEGDEATQVGGDQALTFIKEGNNISIALHAELPETALFIAWAIKLGDQLGLQPLTIHYLTQIAALDQDIEILRIPGREDNEPT